MVMKRKDGHMAKRILGFLLEMLGLALVIGSIVFLFAYFGGAN